jgi:transcriptional regulator of heat shock response
MQEIFSKGESFDKIQIVYGKELGEKELEPVGLMFVSVNVHGHDCRLGVLGSERFNYPYLVPMMKYFKNLIEEMV